MELPAWKLFIYLFIQNVSKLTQTFFVFLQVNNVSGDPEAFVNDRNDQIGVAQPMVHSQKPIYLPRWVISVLLKILLQKQMHGKYITFHSSVDFVQWFCLDRAWISLIIIDMNYICSGWLQIWYLTVCNFKISNKIVSRMTTSVNQPSTHRLTQNDWSAHY